MSAGLQDLIPQPGSQGSLLPTLRGLVGENPGNEVVNPLEISNNHSWSECGDICSRTTHFDVACKDSCLSVLFPARDVSTAKCPKG